VPLSLLQVVVDMPHDQLGKEIGDLRASEFLFASSSSDTEVAFKHALIQTVAYEGMLRKQRRDLHAQVVGAMESLFADRLDEFTERLADHALRGESWETAVSYAFKAGDRAIGRWAWREAITFYDNAIQALEHLPETPNTMQLSIEARLRLRVALPGVADLPRIARCLDKAREFAETLEDRERLAEIDTSKCLTLTKMGLLDQAVEAGRQGFTFSRDLQNKGPLLNASFALAQAYWYQGEFHRAETLVTEMLPDIRGEFQLRQTGTTGTASLLSFVCLAKTYAVTGQFERAFATIAEARRVAEDSNKPFDLSYCKVGLGFCLLANNEPWSAVKELEGALHLARAGDIGLLIPSSQRYLGRAYAQTARLQEARDLLLDAIERTTVSGLLGMRLWSSAALGLTELLASTPTARETLLTTLEAARRYGFRPLEAHVMRLIANLCAVTPKQAKDAETWYQRSIRLTDELGMKPEGALARRDLAGLLHRIGRIPA
jgi:tetratricopeptide (TPR) repeat protein